MDRIDEARIAAAALTESDEFDSLSGGRSPKEVLEAANRETLFTRGFSKKKFVQRIETAYRIQDKGTGAFLPWGPLLRSNPAQLKLLRHILKACERGGPVRILVLKGRKVGVSTGLVNTLLEMVMQVPGFSAGIVAHSAESTEALYRIARNSYDGMAKMPDRPEARSNTQTSLEFGHRHKEVRDTGADVHKAGIWAKTARGAYPFAGMTMQLFLFSEVAKWDSVGDINAQQAFILSALGSVPKLGPSLVVAETTANGMEGWFYETWQRASSTAVDPSGSMWECIFISWLDDVSNRQPVHPDYDWDQWDEDDKAREAVLRGAPFFADDEQLMFRRHTIYTDMNMDTQLFDQEFPTTADQAFIASGRPAIPRAYLDTLIRHIKKPEKRYRTAITQVDQGMTVSVGGKNAPH